MVRYNRLILYVSTILMIIGIVILISSTTLFIMSTMEDNRRDKIGADITLVGTVDRFEEVREEVYTPMFIYEFKGSKYEIGSEYIVCETEKEALSHKDVTVRLNSITGEAYIEECRNLKGQFYSMEKMSDRSLIYASIGAVLLIASFICMVKFIEK